jgi:hypothetical protein
MFFSTQIAQSSMHIVRDFELNHPTAGKGRVAPLLAIEHYCPGVPEPGR